MADLPRGVALLDTGYGNNSDLRADMTALGRTYAAGILSTTTVWARGCCRRSGGRVAMTVEADAARRKESTGLGQGADAQPAEAGLASGRTARGAAEHSSRASRACTFARPIATNGAPSC